MDHSFSDLPKKFLPNSRSQRFSSVFKFKILGLIYIYISHLHLEVKYGLMFIFLHMTIQLFQHSLLKRLFFPPLNCLYTFVENLVVHICAGGISGLCCSIDLFIYLYFNNTLI